MMMTRRRTLLKEILDPTERHSGKTTRTPPLPETRAEIALRYIPTKLLLGSVKKSSGYAFG
jgi:hypothetical protein